MNLKFNSIQEIIYSPLMPVHFFRKFARIINTDDSATTVKIPISHLWGPFIEEISTKDGYNIHNENGFMIFNVEVKTAELMIHCLKDFHYKIVEV